MTAFLLLVLIAVVLGLLGALIHGLLWLLAIGVVVFVLALLGVGWRLSRRRDRTGPR